MLTAPLSGHQVMINGHALCPPLFFVRGCDPCRPGTAVQVERPQRSEDDRPGRSAVSGTAWRQPPRSRNVACAARRCLSEWRGETGHRSAVAAAGGSWKQPEARGGVEGGSSLDKSASFQPCRVGRGGGGGRGGIRQETGFLP